MPQIIDVPGMGEVEFPDTMSDEDITAAIKRSLPPPASTFDKAVGSVGGRFLKGMADPFIGAAQIGANLVGQGDRANQLVADLEAAKQRGMQAHGTEGFDWAGLIGSLAPGAAVAKGASVALPAAKTLLGKMGIGAATGAVASGLQPVNNPQDFTGSKLQQMAMGGAFGAAIPAVAQVAMAGKALAEPFYQKGRDAILGRTLNTAAGGQSAQAMQALEQAKPIIPGSMPTVGQASNNAGLASLERAAVATSPEATVLNQLRMADQNAARMAAIQKVAGSGEDMADAVLKRKLASSGLLQQVTTSPAEVNPSRTVNLIDRITAKSPGRTQLTSTLENVKKSLFEPYPLAQRSKDAWTMVNDKLQSQPNGLNDTEVLSGLRTILSRAKSGKIDAEEALRQASGLQGATSETKQILDHARTLLKADDYRLRSNVSQLYQGARKNITDLLNARAGDGSKLNEAISRELSVVLKSLDNQIGKAEPAYTQYLKTYHDFSKPINQMEVGQAVADKAISPTGDVHLNALARALNDKLAQRATGFKRATIEGVLTPEQMGTLNSVKDDLMRAAQARNMAGTAGSDTVRKLAYTNMIDRAGVPTFLREFAPTQIVGNMLARGADSVYGRANKELAQQLAESLLDPKRAALLMRNAGPQRYAPMIDALMQQGGAMAGTMAGRSQ